MHLDGQPVRSCQTPVSAAANHEITTIEGIHGKVAEAVQRPCSTKAYAVASTHAYAETYRKLTETAERLRKGGPDNVDTLVADFRSVIKGYHFCQERLDAIRTEIDAELDRMKRQAA